MRTGWILAALAVMAAGASSAKPRIDFAAILADPIRPEADRVRDADRKPAEVVAFSGVRPGDKIAELAPGGGYFIVDHEAGKGVGASVTSTLHRIESALVKREVEAAGFRLEATSPLLRHPADDHSQKVQETGIRGKTDQFVLRFRKPRH
jgi:predicted methyltransferase